MNHQNSRGGGAMDNNARFYPDLDLTPLLGVGNFAVQVKTEEEAEHFLEYMFRTHRDRCIGWTRHEHNFGSYSTTCYRPNLNMPKGFTMKYCSLEHYEREHFTIIQFEDLLVQADIEECDKPLSFLFGGAVQ